MGYLLNELARTFHFTKFTEVVAAVCLVLVFASLLGGMISSIAKAFGGPLRPLKLSQTSGFRLLMIMELFLIMMIIYYHLAVLSRFEPLQGVFWVTTMTAMPVLWIIGSQITYLVFWSKIKKNKEAYKKLLARKRAAKHKKLRNKISKDGRTTAQAMLNTPRSAKAGAMRGRAS